MLDLPVIGGAVLVALGAGALIRAGRRARVRHAGKGIAPQVERLDALVRHAGRKRPVRADLEDAIRLAKDIADRLQHSGAVTLTQRELASLARRALEAGDPDTARELLRRACDELGAMTRSRAPQTSRPRG